MNYEDMSIQDLQKEINAMQLVLFRKVVGDPMRSVLTVGGCVCNKYKRGEVTGGWLCPLHGHQM